MDMSVVLAGTLLSGLLGLAVGSFLNVVLIRTAARRPFVAGRSRCPHCARPLSWYELIPVASFVLLGGRCRTCHARLSLQYLLMEIVTAVSFMAVWLRFGSPLETMIAFAVTSILILIAAYDGRWSLIPDGYTLSLAVVAFAAAFAIRRDPLDLLYGVAIGAGVFWIQYAISRGAWVGSGDILLGAALGLLLGWRQTLGALGLAYIIGALVALPLLRQKAGAKRMIPFGPFLVLGAWVSWLWGPWLWNWYLLLL